MTTTNSLAAAAARNTPPARRVAGWTVGTNQVSVVNDPVNAYPGGSNLLALASGSLAATFPTVPGQTYTLKLPYRGPGIAGWWRGENNAKDSIYGNNGIISLTTTNTIVWTNGFEGGGPGNYRANAGTNFAGGWFVEGPSDSSISVITNGTST